MDVTAVRTALVDLLEGIPAIGRVHGYERFAAREADFIALYTDGSASPVRVKGWNVRRLAVLGRRPLASGRTLVATRWLITGYLSLVDTEASEIAMDDLVDLIVDAERADPTLGGLVRGLAVNGQTGIRLTESGAVMFAGVLCHGVKLILDTEVFEGDQFATGLADVVGADGRIIEAVVDHLRSTVATVFSTIEGRLAWDANDDPASVPAAIVLPLADRSEPEPETMAGRQRIDRAIGVVVTAPAVFDPGDGARAAGGLEVLRTAVRDALLGWGEGVDDLEFSFLYAGGEPVEAAPGFIAWRETFQPALFVEP